MKPIRILIAIIAGIILAHCATPMNPRGGPRDEVAPKILSSTPQNYSTNFIAKEVSIEFDEYVKLTDIYKELLISPPLESRPNFRIKKKSLVFEIEEELLKNTTYTFFLGNSIGDITENNKFKNLEYVFSTGDFVDSLSIKGKVLDAITGEAIEDVSVMLYTTDRDSINIDSLPYLSRPTYVAKTDKSGSYELNSLRDIPFLIFVLNDQNANYLYDLPNEAIAFSDTLIIPYPTTNIPDKIIIDSLTNDTTIIKSRAIIPIDLLMFTAQDTIQNIISVEISEDKNIEIILKNEVESYDFDVLDYVSDLNFLIEDPNKTNDTLNFWLKGSLPDSLSFVLSLEGIIFDTLYFEINMPERVDNARRQPKKSDKEPKKAIKIESNIKKHFIGYKEGVELEFDYPLEIYDFSKFILMEDSVVVVPTIEFSDSTFRRINISTDFDENKNYELTIPDSCLYDIVNRSNDSLYYSFKTRKLEDYGSLIVILESKYDCQFIIQLTNEQGDILIERIAKKGDILKFENLSPAKYKLQAIIDANNNGKWDTGSYNLKRQAEKINFFNSVLDIRSNWEVEENWMIN